jgi:hypothetical protein
MSTPHSPEHPEEPKTPDLRRWLIALMIAGALVLSGVFGTYIAFFHDHDFKTDSENWGQFGDFVGGAANPIIGFLSLVAFVLTLLLQNRQLQISVTELRLSRQELELTRHELHRAAKAQELSEQALRAQANTAERTAELSTYSFLVTSYRAELESMQGQVFMASDSRAKRPEELRIRLAHLEFIVDSLYTEVASERP